MFHHLSHTGVPVRKFLSHKIWSPETSPYSISPYIAILCSYLGSILLQVCASSSGKAGKRATEVPGLTFRHNCRKRKKEMDFSYVSFFEAWITFPEPLWQASPHAFSTRVLLMPSQPELGQIHSPKLTTGRRKWDFHDKLKQARTCPWAKEVVSISNTQVCMEKEWITKKLGWTWRLDGMWAITSVCAR